MKIVVITDPNKADLTLHKNRSLEPSIPSSEALVHQPAPTSQPTKSLRVQKTVCRWPEDRQKTARRPSEDRQKTFLFRFLFSFFARLPTLFRAIKRLATVCRRWADGADGRACAAGRACTGLPARQHTFAPSLHPQLVWPLHTLHTLLSSLFFFFLFCLPSPLFLQPCLSVLSSKTNILLVSTTYFAFQVSFFSQHWIT